MEISFFEVLPFLDKIILFVYDFKKYPTFQHKSKRSHALNAITLY